MFEYDPAKSEENRLKHGIDFEAAQALWNDDSALRLPSGLPTDEERWLVIGRIAQKLWTAIVTERGDALRLISVRRARDYEEELYGRRKKESERRGA